MKIFKNLIISSLLTLFSFNISLINSQSNKIEEATLSNSMSINSKSEKSNFITINTIYKELKNPVDRIDLAQKIIADYLEKYTDSDLSKLSHERINDLYEFIKLVQEDISKLTEDEKLQISKDKTDFLDKALNNLLEKFTNNKNKRKIKKITLNAIKGISLGTIGIFLFTNLFSKSPKLIDLHGPKKHVVHEFDNLLNTANDLEDRIKLADAFVRSFESGFIFNKYEEQKIMDPGWNKKDYFVWDQSTALLLLSYYKNFAKDCNEKGASHEALISLEKGFKTIVREFKRREIITKDFKVSDLSLYKYDLELSVLEKKGELHKIYWEKSRSNYLIKINRSYANIFLFAGAIASFYLIFKSIYISIAKIKEIKANKNKKDESNDDEGLMLDNSNIDLNDENLDEDLLYEDL